MMTRINDWLKQSVKHTRGLFIPTALVRMTGCYRAAALLRQIIYWLEPGDNGQPRDAIPDKDGRLWVVRSRTDWDIEIALSPKQVDRALAILLKRNLILKRVVEIGRYRMRMTHLALHDSYPEAWSPLP